MTNFHAWKRRIWGPDYPFENGPPYRDPGTGAPILPGGVTTGPFNGIDDDGPAGPGNPITLTFSGTATDTLNVGVLILDQSAGAPEGGRWAGATITVQNGATADAVAAALAARFDAYSWPGMLPVGVAGAALTFTPQAAGTLEGWVIYSPAGAGVSRINFAGELPETPGDFVFVNAATCEIGIAVGNNVNDAVFVPTTFIDSLSGPTPVDKAFLKEMARRLAPLCPVQTSQPPPPPGDFVQGPYQTKGKKYWIQRDAGEWFVWFDIVPEQGDNQPDTRTPIQAYLDDPAHAEFAPAIRRKAQGFGWEG